MKVGDATFEGYFVGFAIRRFWRAIDRETTQRTATKSYEGP